MQVHYTHRSHCKRNGREKERNSLEGLDISQQAGGNGETAGKRAVREGLPILPTSTEHRPRIPFSHAHTWKRVPRSLQGFQGAHSLFEGGHIVCPRISCVEPAQSANLRRSLRTLGFAGTFPGDLALFLPRSSDYWSQL